ncbi:MAG: family transcriptional regulator, aerobic/anaerobic benzoate catabolism transcriptional [Myxococcales bacterium]|nr:family transcriptional regulator, aerobic/anaerobic benzoate catabolism transcriptional [Myxococcales bacterium]
MLGALGAAVRARRNGLGMTMRELAKKAGVSERFLVQLENGEGNISVARLEDVAEGLGTTGAELLATASEAGKAPATPGILALVGLRGAGKSSIGATVADRLGVPFVELDELIVREAQMTLSTIFEIHGERYYRGVEREVLRRLLVAAKPMVIATGGSIVTDAETWGLLRSRAQTIWLKATPHDHWDRVVAQGDVRPMRDRPRAMNELQALLTRREPLYELADAVVDTAGKPPESVVDDVLAIGRRPAR